MIPLGWPVDPSKGVRISSMYGPRRWPWPFYHRGIDIAVPEGTPVLAMYKYEREFMGWLSGFGKCVILKHPTLGKEIYTVYGHMSQLICKSGGEKGEVVGRSGNTGNSTNPHLHIGLWIGGKSDRFAFDFFKWLPRDIYLRIYG